MSYATRPGSLVIVPLVLLAVACDGVAPSADAGDILLPDGAVVRPDGRAPLPDGALPPPGPCESVRPFPGGMGFAGSGELTARYGVTHWALSGTPSTNGDVLVEAMGFGPSGAVELVGWLQAPSRSAALALSSDSTEDDVALALPAMAFEPTHPAPGALEHTFGIDDAEVLRVWAEIADALPPAECFVSETALRVPVVDRMPGTPLATCEAPQAIANAELVVSIARTLRLIGCMAESRLGTPITTCDLEDLGSFVRDQAIDRAADAIERAEIRGREPVVVPKGDLPDDPEEMDRLFERIRRESETRKTGLERWQRRFAAALRLVGDVLSVADLIRSFVQAWSPYVDALDELGCCQGGNVGGRTGCTCAERFPPDAEGRGGAPVWRRLPTSPTSYVCEPCEEGYVWDPDAAPFADDPSLPVLARELSRPVGDRGACVREIEPPRWDACPSVAGRVDYDALRARADAFQATVGDARVQVVDVRVDGMPCPALQRVRAYLPCGQPSEEYMIAPVGGAVTTIGTSLCALGRCDWVYHLGYRPNGMLERGEISPGTTDGFGSLWTAGGAVSRDPVAVCNDIVSRAPLGGRGVGAPLIAYPDHTLDEAGRVAAGLPEVEGGWCYDEIDFIDMAHHLETSGTCSPTVFGALLAVIYPRSLTEIRDPQQAERRCVGAVGSDTCVPPQAAPLPNACGAGHVGAGDGCVADPHYAPLAGGFEHHGVSVESLDYAECCRESPDGFMCRGTVGSLRCAIVFNASMHAMQDGARTWRSLFSTEPAPPTLSTIDAAGVPTSYGRLLAAPAGTPLGLDASSELCRTGGATEGQCTFPSDEPIATELERAVSPEGRIAGPSPSLPEELCERIDPRADVSARERARAIPFWATGHRSLVVDSEGSLDYPGELDRREAAIEELEEDPLWEHHELWVQRDRRGVVQAAALFRLYEHPELGVAEGWELIDLSAAEEGYAPMLLDCATRDLRARGELPIRVMPAPGAEAWWASTVARITDPARTIPVWPVEVEADGTLVLGRTIVDLHSHLNGVPSWEDWVGAAGFGPGGRTYAELVCRIARRLHLGLWRGDRQGWMILYRELPDFAVDPDRSEDEQCASPGIEDETAQRILRLWLTASNGADFTHAYVLRGRVHDIGFVGRGSEQPEAALRLVLQRLCAEGIAYSEQSVSFGQLNREFSPDAVARAYATLPPDCRVEIRFLAAISRSKLTSRRAETDAALRQALMRPDVVGIDIVGPEYDRLGRTAGPRIVELVQLVTEAARLRGRPLLFRPHVGEGALGSGSMLPELGTIPLPEDGGAMPDHHIWGGRRGPSGEPTFVPPMRENLDQMVDLIQPFASEIVDLEALMRDPTAIDGTPLVVRFGHATHATPAIARRMATLGVLADVNLTSNWTTGASQPRAVSLSMLPDRSLHVATSDLRMVSETLHPFHEHGVFAMLTAGVPITLGTDGQGVEWSSMSGLSAAETPDGNAVPGEPQRLLEVLESCFEGRATAFDAQSCMSSSIPRAERQRLAATAAWGNADRYLQMICTGDEREGLPISRACVGRRR